MRSNVKTVQQAIDMYIEDLRVNQCKESHLVSTRARLNMMFPKREVQFLTELHPVVGQRLYDEMRQKKKSTGTLYAVDTQRHSLLQSRAMCKWLISKHIMDENPFDGVEGVGRRKRGKTQLSIDEARAFVETCLAEESTGATAALCCLMLAMRSGEIVGLGARSIDDGGRILRIDVAKTEAGVRLIEIPEVLRDRLPALVAASFDRHFVNRQVHRLCRKAGVTDVGPHALRGTHASLATRAGATSQLVADTLGHASTSVTHRHYTKASAIDASRTQAALTVLAGGVK
jgi:integrase